MKHIALVASLSIFTSAILLDDVTTFIGLSKGYVETNPIYPYSLFITPLFFTLFLVTLEIVGKRVIPQQYSRHYTVFMLIVASLAFKGFINNIVILGI